MFKYGVSSGPYFPAFGLNRDGYSVSLRFQSPCGKMMIRKNSVFGHFSRSESYLVLMVAITMLTRKIFSVQGLTFIATAKNLVY